jgi:hypothetical protein
MQHAARCLAITSLLLAACRGRVPAAQAPAAPSAPKWRYAHEQSWLVAETLGSLDGLAHLARHKEARADAEVMPDVADAPAGRGYVFHVKTHQGEAFDLTIDDYLLSPAVFAPVAKRWLDGMTAHHVKNDRHVAGVLVSPTIGSLHAINVAVSDALTRDPLDVEAHEDAALLVAAFALKDHAAGHTDTRRLQTRIVAHLAMAQALRGTQTKSASGRLASVALLVLGRRNAAAIATLDNEPAIGSPDEKAWARALRLRATDDWRLASWDDNLTLFERLALFEAQNERIHTDRVMQRALALPQEQRQLADWGRIVLNGDSSVGQCQFAMHGWRWDMAETDQASRLFRGGIGVDGAAPAATLNVEPTTSEVRATAQGPQVEVIDWGTVAAFEQRQLGARLSYELACYERIYGLPDDTAKTAQSQEAMFGQVTLFPVETHRWVKTREDYERLAASGVRLVRERPQLVTQHLWMLLGRPTPLGRPVDLPPYTDWFVPLQPLGMNLPGRLEEMQVPAAAFDAVVAVDPYDTGAHWARIRLRHGEKPDYATVVAGLGPALEWTLEFMLAAGDLAPAGSAEQLKWLGRRCDIDADGCERLGYALKEAHEDEKAAEAYRRQWREGADRVLVANSMQWLVDYDNAHGKREEAFRIARDAADTFSARGLLTLAKLDEDTSDLDGAALVLRKMADRYASQHDLVEFYDRRLGKGETRWRNEREAAMKKLFPVGIEKVDAPPSGPPMDGVYLADVEPAGHAAGFQENDVVVSLDGTRVHSRDQWAYVWDLSKGAEKRILIWRQGQYIEVRRTFTGRNIGTHVYDYPKERA